MNVNEYSLWTAVVTPFLENESVDYKSLEVLLRDQEKADNGLTQTGVYHHWW